MSACIFMDTLKNDTQVAVNFEISLFDICLHSININFTPYFLISSTLTRNAGTSKEIPLHASELTLPSKPNHFSMSTLLVSCNFSINKLKTFLEQPSNQRCSLKPNTPIVFNSTEKLDNKT